MLRGTVVLGMFEMIHVVYAYGDHSFLLSTVEDGSEEGVEPEQHVVPSHCGVERRDHQQATQNGCQQSESFHVYVF